MGDDGAPFDDLHLGAVAVLLGVVRGRQIDPDLAGMPGVVRLDVGAVGDGAPGAFLDQLAGDGGRLVAGVGQAPRPLLHCGIPPPAPRRPPPPARGPRPPDPRPPTDPRAPPPRGESASRPPRP